MIIVGIDCATDARKIGLAFAEFSGDQACVLNHVEVGTSFEEVVEAVSRWIARGEPSLLALDAPLGWPQALAPALSDHLAGLPISVDPNLLFRRESDRFVKSMIGKQSLDVGADRIARTAHAALGLLGTLRAETGRKIPLAWSSDLGNDAAAIEVYPAATLVAHGIRSSQYKRPDQRGERAEIVGELSKRMEIRAGDSTMQENDNALDAAVCVLAACDFLSGHSMPPPDLASAEREGWMWVRRPTKAI